MNPMQTEETIEAAKWAEHFSHYFQRQLLLESDIRSDYRAPLGKEWEKTYPNPESDVELLHPDLPGILKPIAEVKDILTKRARKVALSLGIGPNETITFINLVTHAADVACHPDELRWFIGKPVPRSPAGS